MTALRKLYLQPGGGRVMGAFMRGIKPDHRLHMGEVLESLVEEGFASISNRTGETIYLKNNEKSVAAREILEMKGKSNNPLVARFSQIGASS